jgi:hypothetical protein
MDQEKNILIRSYLYEALLRDRNYFGITEFKTILFVIILII